MQAQAGDSLQVQKHLLPPAQAMLHRFPVNLKDTLTLHMDFSDLPQEVQHIAWMYPSPNAKIYTKEERDSLSRMIHQLFK